MQHALNQAFRVSFNTGLASHETIESGFAKAALVQCLWLQATVNMQCARAFAPQVSCRVHLYFEFALISSYLNNNLNLQLYCHRKNRFYDCRSTMDLLDSILNGMEKPPSVKKPEIKDKDKREKFEKMQKERQEAARKHKETVNKFRVDMSKRIRDFVNTPTTSDMNSIKLELKPMSKLYRTIVREICDEYDDELVVHSFGDDEVDRHCVIWRKGYEPCEEEIRAMKLGVEYKPKNQNDDEQQDDNCDEAADSKTKDGKDKFWSKYEKIIGENASGLESARVAEPARQYGCVPIDKKKDQRSIEEMMDDIRRKKQKTDSSCKDTQGDQQPDTKGETSCG
jgi:hypothetical protein